jgi:PAS domain-containing protein
MSKKEQQATGTNKEFNRRKIHRYIRADFKTLQGRITIGFLLIGFFAIIMLLSSHFIWKNQLKKSRNLIALNKNSATRSAEIQQLVDLTTILTFRYISTQDDFFPKDIEKRWNKDINAKLNELDSLTQKLGNDEVILYVTKLTEHLPKIRATQQEALEQQSTEVLNSEETINDIIHLTFLSTSLKDKLNQLEAQVLAEIEATKNRIPYILGVEFIISLIVSTLIALFIIQTVLRRIKYLKVKIREMSEGNLPEELPHSQDELNSIIKALNELVRNLKGITHFAEEVGKGQFDTEITVFENQGHLGESLAEMRTKLQNVAEQDKRRVWFNEGVAKFGDILRKNNDNIEDLSAKLISELVNYTNSNQGSIFIVDNQDERNIKLVLKGAYAYQRQKYVEKELAPGQGLVGQAYLERDHIYLSEIPEEYISIRSGLGEAPPTHLLISPMKLNDEIFGIIELASFKPFEPYHIEFIEKVGESIASTIQGLQVSLETKSLLEESQMKAEQLQAQEEEMRQNAEELEATQEEMERQGREIGAFKNAISQSAMIFEMEQDGSITSANPVAESKTKFTSDDLINKQFSLLDSNFITDLPEKVLPALQANESFKKIDKISRKDGTTFDAYFDYMPIVDENQQMKKIMCMALELP